MMKQAEILVLGASGNVGSEVVRSLTGLGEPVRVGGSRPERLRDAFGDSVEALRFDFTEPDTWAAAFAGMKKLFLMRPPAIANIRRDMIPALEAAKAAGVKEVTFLSLIGIEKLTMVPHWQVEQWLRASGLEWTFLRCGFFMQNLSTTHRAEIRDDNEIFVPVGKAKTAFIDVRDIGAVAALTLTQSGHAGKAYDLTGAEAFDYHQVASMLSGGLGRTIHYRAPSGLAFFLRQLGQREPLMFALVTTWLYGNTRKGMAAAVTGEVERLLGRPPIGLRQFMEDCREVWMK